MKSRTIRRYFFVILVLTTLSSHAKPAPEFTFALMGDLPYGVKIGKKSPEFETMLQQVNADEALSWVVHVGDIKTGGNSCSNAFLNDRKQRFERLNPAFVLTPGDNEWTDCHRIQAGNFDPLDRLDYLRQIFFGPNEKLKKAADQLMVQSDEGDTLSPFSENLLWQKNSVTFATIHIVGSLNGNAGFSLLSRFKRSKKYDEEIIQRDNAAIHWLEKTFKTAKETQSPGIFIAIHANPGFLHGISRKEKKPYNAFRKKLHALVKDYKKPVILAHGDTHTFQINKPELWKGSTPKNFTRVETFGGNNGSWIKVSVDPASPGVFSFMPIDN